jgi:Zinc knuckle
MADHHQSDHHHAHPAGLDFTQATPGVVVTQRATSSANGWFADGPETPAQARGYKTFLADMNSRFANNFDGYKSLPLVSRWFTWAEQALLEKAEISGKTFTFMAPALATHYAVALTNMLFTDEVPARITTVNSPLKEAAAEYDQSIGTFRLMRKRYVVPFARLLLYTLVAANKRAEVVQALTMARGSVQRVGDVIDYIALKGVLTSKAFIQMETLHNAVFKNGVAKAAAVGTGSVHGVTRTIVLAMKEESNAMYNYMLEEFADRALAAPDLDTAVYTGNDLKAMASKLILGHHLGATLSSQALETLRRQNLLVRTDVHGQESIVLEVPMIDPEGVLARLDLPLRRAWLSNYGDALPPKKHDGPAKRKKATAPAEPNPPTTVANTAAAEATGHRSSSKHLDKRPKAGGHGRSSSSSSASSSTSSSSRAADQSAISSARPPRSQPPGTHPSTPASQNGAPRPTRRSTSLCYNCAEVGHWSPECSKPKVECAQCGRTHIPGPCIASKLPPPRTRK